MLTRIGDAASNRIFQSQISSLRSRLFETTLQANTKMRSQDYKGLGSDVYQLLTTEASYDRQERFKHGNMALETRLKTMGQATQGIEKGVKDFRKSVIDFRSHNGEASPEYMEKIALLRQQSYALLNDFQYYLNQDNDGRFLFGGGLGNRAPVSLPISDLKTFASIYDGTNVTYPETRAANLFNKRFGGLDLEFNNGLVGGKTYGAMTSPSGSPPNFITGSVGDVGTITWRSSVPNPVSGVAEGSIESPVAGAFSGVTTGSTLLIESGVNRGVYTVTEVSEDGRSVKLTPPPPTDATENPGAGGYAINIGVPNGSTIKIQNSSGNDAYYTVRWPDNNDLATAGLLNEAIAGRLLLTTPPFAATTPPGAPQTGVSIAGQGYYQGDDMSSEHRIDENRRLKIDVNGQDPAFEKAIRAAGLLAQDLPRNAAGEVDLDAFNRRVAMALDLLNDAISHNPQGREGKSDLARVNSMLALSEKAVVNAREEQDALMSLMEEKIVNVKGVDLLETIARMNEEMRTLEGSYQVLARMQKLSLTNYL